MMSEKNPLVLDQEVLDKLKIGYQNAKEPGRAPEAGIDAAEAVCLQLKEVVYAVNGIEKELRKARELKPSGK